VTAVLSNVAKAGGLNSLLPELVERGFHALGKPDQDQLVEDLLFSKSPGPLPLRLAVVRTLKARGLYDTKLAIKLFQRYHGDDTEYQVAALVLDDCLQVQAGRFPFGIAASVANARGIPGSALWRDFSKPGKTGGPVYQLQERAAKAILAWWTEPAPDRPSLPEQISGLRGLLKEGNLDAVVNVILPALLPGWSLKQVRDFLTEMVQHPNECVRRSVASHLHQYGLMTAELRCRFLLDAKFLVMEQVWRDQMSSCKQKQKELQEKVIPIDVLIEAANGSLPSFLDQDANAREMKEAMKKIREEAIQCLRSNFPFLNGGECASVAFPFEIAASVATGFDQANGPGYALAEQAARAIVNWWTQAGPGQLSAAEQKASLQELLNRGHVAAVVNVVLPALLPGWLPQQVRDVLTDMAQHTNERVRCAAAHQLLELRMIDAELLRRLLLDSKFLVTEQVWRERCESDVPVDLLVEAAKGSLPSFQDRCADARRTTEIQKEAVECLRNKLPSLSAEERPAVEAVLHDVERRTQAEAQAKAYRGETCPRCRSSFGWGSKYKHCGFPLQ
jgi:hypothetical protein